MSTIDEKTYNIAKTQSEIDASKIYSGDYVKIKYCFRDNRIKTIEGKIIFSSSGSFIYNKQERNYFYITHDNDIKKKLFIFWSCRNIRMDTLQLTYSGIA